MIIKSPVTGSSNTSVICDLDVPRIIAMYKKDFGLDTERFFTGLENIQVVECRDTKYRFYYPFNIFGDDEFYQFLQKFDMYYPKDKWEHKKTLSLIEENKAVLEIGSGAGFFMQKLLDKKCTRLSGLELNSKAVADSRAKGLDTVNETIEGFAQKNAGLFDVVCALQVLEHITDVRPFINASLKALKPGGKLIFCVPNNNPYFYRHDIYHTLNLPPHHSGLWNKASFSNLPEFFPMRLKKVHIETFTDYKEWYRAQVNYLREKNSFLAPVLSLLPDRWCKFVLKPIRYLIEGRNILVEYIKL
jgi:SAM-dependent methyltransferase